MTAKQFQSTQWSVVRQAARADDAAARAALVSLCERYWYPIYAFLRRKGVAPERAEDVTQGFFARLIEKRVLEQADPARGRFRSFLLTAVQNFLANERDYTTAQKRGGGRAVLSLDAEAGESRLSVEPAHALTPEKLFDRAWAFHVLELVVERLRTEFVVAGKATEFEVLRPFLAGRHASASYEETAASLGRSATALRQAAHRLRDRYRVLLRAEVGETVSGEDEVEDEIRGLFAALAG